MMEAFKQKLWRYLRAGRVHPALIFSTPGSEDIWSLAKGVAKFFLCKSPSESKPFCGQCNACRRVDAEIHPDLILIREQGEDHIKIETIRELCEQMALSPMEGNAKIVIIDRCQRMNVAASNAFLKTLEEPLPDRYFILLTSQPKSLLPTIVSRCMQFRVPVTGELEASQILDPELQKVLDGFFAGGELRPLIQKLDDKERATSLVQHLMHRLRDAMIAKSQGLAVASPWKTRSEEHLLVTFDALSRIDLRLRSNANYGLMLENFFRQHL